MKLRISSIFLLALTASAFAGGPVVEPTPAPGKMYIGVFGGGGASNSFNTGQFGTALFPELAGGPLAVNAFGQLGSASTGFYGAQIGYQEKEIFLGASSQWALAPAAELEGYYMNTRTLSGTVFNNNFALPGHTFAVSYPMNRTIFLANAIVGFDNTSFPVHPYVGLGIGQAILGISGANSAQIGPLPPEVGVNHFNSDPSDTSTTFAGQVKVGLSYDFNDWISIFADYRWLYLADTHFLFGSTVYPTHAVTTPWQVTMAHQSLNLGDIGLRFKF